MNKTLTIDRQEVAFKCTPITLAIYRKQFKRNFAKDIVKLEEQGKLFGLHELQSGDLNLKELELYHEIIWSFAKTANSKIPSPYKWLEGFDLFPIYEILPKLQELMLETIKLKTKELRRCRQ